MRNQLPTQQIVVAIMILLCSLPHPGMAQREGLRFMKNDGSIAGSLAEADYIRRVEAPNPVDGWAVLKEFYMNLQLRRQGYLMDGSTVDRPMLHGRVLSYYENGHLQSEISYNKGSLTGSANYYYPNGQLKKTVRHARPDPAGPRSAFTVPDTLLVYRDSLGVTLVADGNGHAREPIVKRSSPEDAAGETEGYEEGVYRDGLREGRWTGVFMNGRYTFSETYIAGMLVSGISRDSTGNEYPYTELENRADREANQQSIRDYVGKTFQYPKAARDAAISGVLVVEFVIKEDGRIADIRVIGDLGYGTDDEAISVLGRFRDGRLKPGYRRGVRDDQKYTLPIRMSIGR